jgi:hypothetical protein
MNHGARGGLAALGLLMVCQTPGLALAQAAAPALTLREFGLDRSGAGDLTWRSARRTGDVLELREVRSGAATMARALVSLDADVVRRVRFEEVRVPEEGLFLRAVELIEPTPGLLRAGASAFVGLDPLKQPAGGPVGAAQLRIEDIEAKEADGAVAIAAAQFDGFSLTDAAIGFDALNLSGLRFTAADASSSVVIDSARLAGPTPTMVKLMAEGAPAAAALSRLVPGADAAGAAGKTLRASDLAWFRDVSVSGLRIESKVGGTAARANGRIDTEVAPPAREQRVSLAVESFKVEGFERGAVGLIELAGVSGRFAGGRGEPQGSFTFEGLTIRDFALDYFLTSITQSLRAATEAAAGGAAASSGAAALAGPPALPGRPLDPGFSAFSLGAIEAEAQGARLSISPLRYDLTRAPDGYVTAIASAPWTFALRAERTQGPEGAFGAVLAQGLADFGYPAGLTVRLMPGTSAMDRVRDQVSVRDAGLEWVDGLGLSMQLQLAGAQALLAASRNPRVATQPALLADAAQIAGFGFDLRDLGGLSRLAAFAARRSAPSQTPAQTRASWAAQVEALGEASGVERAILAGLARWLRDGGRLLVTAAPAAPVPSSSLIGDGKGWKRLNLTVENRP